MSFLFCRISCPPPTVFFGVSYGGDKATAAHNDIIQPRKHSGNLPLVVNVSNYNFFHSYIVFECLHNNKAQ